MSTNPKPLAEERAREILAHHMTCARFNCLLSEKACLYNQARGVVDPYGPCGPCVECRDRANGEVPEVGGKRLPWSELLFGQPATMDKEKGADDDMEKSVDKPKALEKQAKKPGPKKSTNKSRPVPMCAKHKTPMVCHGQDKPGRGGAHCPACLREYALVGSQVTKRLIAAGKAAEGMDDPLIIDLGLVPGLRSQLERRKADELRQEEGLDRLVLALLKMYA